MVLMLMHEWGKNEASEWWPWLQTVIDLDFSMIPLHWSPCELQALRGTALALGPAIDHNDSDNKAAAGSVDAVGASAASNTESGAAKASAEDSTSDGKAQQTFEQEVLPLLLSRPDLWPPPDAGSVSSSLWGRFAQCLCLVMSR
jgi:hypothetical protein